MSKNLLIALGDSWTHGAGIYPHIPILGEGLIPRYVIEESPILTNEERNHYLNVFDEREKKFSWPVVCADILGWDVINLGVRAQSNPGVVKLQYVENKLLENYKDKYDRVVMIFLLTDPTRFGLYNNNGRVQSITIRGFSYNNDGNSEQLYKSSPEYIKDYNAYKDIWDLYVNYMVPKGSLLETLFSLEYIKYFTKSCGYEFYWGTAFTPYQEIINKSNMDYCLHNKRFDSFRNMIIEKYKQKGISNCGHANELGYSLIAKYIAHEIQLRGR